MDTYGGITRIKGEATGFFHLDTINDRHFLITPEGNGYRALGINHFHMMDSTDYDGVINQIRDWGFNAGCYQGPRWMWNRYPYTKGINVLSVSQWKSGKDFKFEDVFDAEFLARLENQIKEIVAPQSGNRMLIGYFLTDIPIWTRQRENVGWISFYKSLPANSAGGKVWKEWKAHNADRHEEAFLAVIAKQIYSRSHQLIRKYDPNHLIFSDRYHEVDMPEVVVREALAYADAIAVQPTSREFNHKFFDSVYQKYGKPIYIADHVSSFATPHHPVTMGQATKDPLTYTAYYQRYVTEALSQSYIFGYNKCQYQDQDSGSMLKQGLLNLEGEPYSVVDGIAVANRKALQYAYSGEQP